MFGSLNPIHWILAGSLIVNLLFGGWLYITKQDNENLTITLHAVKLQGEAQAAESKIKDKIAKLAKQKEDDEHQRNIDKLVSDNNRLRKQVANSKLLPTTPQVCTGGGETTSINWPLIEQAIREFRNEVRNLIESGDKEREGLDSVKGWYLEQQD